MAILPTKFIARVLQYPQDAEYGGWCADNTRELETLLRGKVGRCSSWHDSDIPFSDVFLRRHVGESFPERERDFSYDDTQRRLQEPGMALTEDGTLVKGTLRPFNIEELAQLRREFADQQKQSKEGYVYGAPSLTYKSRA